MVYLCFESGLKQTITIKIEKRGGGECIDQRGIFVGKNPKPIELNCSRLVGFVAEDDETGSKIQFRSIQASVLQTTSKTKNEFV